MSCSCCLLRRGHSWLAFGATKIRERIWQHLYDGRGENGDVVSNPCLFRGATDTLVVGEKEIQFAGTGDPVACGRTIREYIWGQSHVMTDDESHVCEVDLHELLLPEEPVPTSAASTETAVTTKKPCPLNDVLLPHPVEGEFYAMSLYYYAFDCLNMLGPEELSNWCVSFLRAGES